MARRPPPIETVARTKEEAAELIAIDENIADRTARLAILKAESERLAEGAWGPHSDEEQAVLKSIDRVNGEIHDLKLRRVAVLAGDWKPPAPEPVKPAPQPTGGRGYLVAPKEWVAERIGEGELNDDEAPRIVTYGALLKFMEEITDEIAEALKSRDAALDQLHDLRTQDIATANANAQVIKALLDRIDTLETAPRLEFKGAWKRRTKYKAGSAVTLDGRIWIAKEATDHKPDPDAPAWTLAVDKGQDGHDPRLDDLRAHVDETMGAHEAGLDSAVRTLSGRLDTIESKQALEYRGVWREGETYAAGTAITHQGGLWISNTESRSVRPGDGSIWRLAVKSGMRVREKHDAKQWDGAVAEAVKALAERVVALESRRT